jgi:hypothetical protein
MILWKRAVLLGLLSWLIPFLVSMPLFPLKQANPPLFEAAMTVVLLLTAGLLLRVYFGGRTVSTGEAVLVGALWLVVNLVFDYPMFSYGPMKMAAAKYYSEIGVDYLIYPVFALSAARLSRREG